MEIVILAPGIKFLLRRARPPLPDAGDPGIKISSSPPRVFIFPASIESGPWRQAVTPYGYAPPEGDVKREHFLPRGRFGGPRGSKVPVFVAPEKR
jgi:hypothetical protein